MSMGICAVVYGYKCLCFVYVLGTNTNTYSHMNTSLNTEYERWILYEIGAKVA